MQVQRGQDPSQPAAEIGNVMKVKGSWYFQIVVESRQLVAEKSLRKGPERTRGFERSLYEAVEVKSGL